jgi:hypothetical protein
MDIERFKGSKSSKGFKGLGNGGIGGSGVHGVFGTVTVCSSTDNSFYCRMNRLRLTIGIAIMGIALICVILYFFLRKSK